MTAYFAIEDVERNCAFMHMTFSTMALALQSKPLRHRSSAKKRTRQHIKSIIKHYGDAYFRKAYRMPKEQFFTLLHIILPYLMSTHSSHNIKQRGCPNGPVDPAIVLSAALRMAAGGKAYNIGLSHGIATSHVYKCLWSVVSQGC